MINATKGGAHTFTINSTAQGTPAYACDHMSLMTEALVNILKTKPGLPVSTLVFTLTKEVKKKSERIARTRSWLTLTMR